jgi:hypothetical protein
MCARVCICMHAVVGGGTTRSDGRPVRDMRGVDFSGTSLPDTLASRIAALEDADADAAIGNITGSNSVNVFLGLGIPWVICSVYYKLKVRSPYVGGRRDMPGMQGGNIGKSNGKGGV